MRPGDKSHFNSLYKTASYTVTTGNMRTYGRIVAQTANIIITLPLPKKVNEWEGQLCNTSAGYVSYDIYDSTTGTTGAFGHGGSSLILAPGEMVHITSAKTADGTYAYLCEGKAQATNWQTWTPTLTYATANPTLYTTNLIARYLVQDGVVFFDLENKKGLCALTQRPPRKETLTAPPLGQNPCAVGIRVFPSPSAKPIAELSIVCWITDLT